MASQDSNTIVQWPLVGGIDERTRAEVVEPTSSFVVLENVRQGQRGGYTKRKGFAQAGTTNTATGWHLTARKDTPLAIGGSDASTLYKFSSTQDTWSSVGALDIADIRRDALATATRAGTIVDRGDVYVFSDNGQYLLAVVFTTIGGTSYTNLLSYVALYDADTLTCLSPPTALGTHTATDAAILVQGSYIIAVVGDIYASSIYVHSASISAIKAGGTSWGESTIAANYLRGMDVCPIDANAYAISFVNNSGTASDVTIKRMLLASPVQTATVNTSTALPSYTAVRCTSSDTLWLAYNLSLDAMVVGYSPSDLTSVTATLGTVTGSAALIGKLAIAIDSTAGSAYLVANANTDLFVRRFYKSAGSITTSGTDANTIPNVELYSKPVNVADDDHSRLLCWTMPYSTSSTARTAVLVDLLTYSGGFVRPAAVAAPRQVWGPVSTILGTPSRRLDKQLIAIATQKNSTYNGLELLTADTKHSRPRSSAEAAGCLFTSGGIVSEYDGAEVHESVFVVRPGAPTTSQSTCVNNITASVGYRYIVLYAYVDANGQVHRSAPSDPSSSTSSFTAKLLTVTARTLGLTSKRAPIVTAQQYRSPITIEFYRTTDGGTTYYVHPQGPVQNVGSANTVTLEDYASDSQLSSGAQLYRQPSVAGAVQPHACPPAMRYLVQHQDRLVGVADDGISVWYSAKHVLGEGIWFADLFQFPVEKGGPITGLASQDGRIYVFKRGTVFVVDGDGPAESGAAGDFGQPYELPSDVGCIDSRSIVTTTAGVFFQSLRGIELLSRGGGISWIGEPIASTLTAYPVVTSAAVLPVERLVMFTCVASENEDGPTGAGVTLVFDYSAGLWVSVDRVTHPTAGTANAAATHAAMLPLSGVPAYHWVDSSGRVYKHQTSSLDGSNWVRAALETGWVKLSGFMGEQHVDRAQLLADFTSNHDVTFSIAYEYRSTYASTRTYTANVVSSQAALGRERLEVVAGNNTRGSAVKIRLSDATPTDPANFAVGTGNGATWIALAIEGSPRRGAARLPSGAR